MSRRAPYFEDYVFLGDVGEPEDQLREKIISGKLKACVYSTLAKSDFEPVSISAAEFLAADEAGWESFSDPDVQPVPFQVMVLDRDGRRPAAVRRHIRVPHWIYVARDQLAKTLKEHAPSEPDERPATRPTSETRIRTEIAAVYAEAAAQETKPPNIKELGKVVQQRLAAVGLGAAQIQIQKIGDEAAFKKLRRLPGATVFSQRGK
ncbi:hypothetical protein ACVWWO_009545 [Bradyrhizobium sp. F1.13.1]